MSDTLLDKVCSRFAVDMTRCLNTGEPTTTTLARIAETVETALVLARREGYDRRPDGKLAREAFPLPTRKRQVLREEPVPGARMDDILYRWIDGELQRCGPLSPGWARAGSVDAHRVDLMAHALDLHANPYRTEQVPSDESDPWGEGDAPPKAVQIHDCGCGLEFRSFGRCTCHCHSEKGRLQWGAGWYAPDGTPCPIAS